MVIFVVIRHFLLTRDYSDIWIGFMSSGYSQWLMAGNTSCIKAYNTATETLPPLIHQSAQCLVLNMSGTNYDDAYYSTPCSEHRAFLCQSQVKIGTYLKLIYIFL